MGLCFHGSIVTILLILSIAITPGCSTVPGAVFPSESTDRADLPFETDGIRYEGTALLQRRTSRKFKFIPPEDTQEMVVTTCHRETFYPVKGVWEWTYAPRMWLENWDSCLLSVTAATRSGRYRLAVIDFTSNETLPAKTTCNGQDFDGAGGASFCQARAGLVQLITFDKRVTGKGSERCNQPYSESGASTDWRWFVDVSPGLCVYAFTGDGKSFHRWTTRGYTPKEGRP